MADDALSDIKKHESWFQFQPVPGMIDAILRQVVGLIGDQGWEVRETRVEMGNEAGKIILPILYDDGSGTERIAYIEPGPWDSVAREDIELWFGVLDRSPRAGTPVTLWSERTPPAAMLTFFGDRAARVTRHKGGNDADS